MRKIIFSLTIISLTLSFQNIFSQGKNIQLVGKLNPANSSSGNNYSALWGYSANGKEYAILGGNQSIYFIDVTDSTNIRVCGSFTTHFSNWHEMKTYSHYAYLVSEADNSGVQIFDLANLPVSVAYVGQYNPPGHSRTHSIQQSGPYLYLNGGTFNGIKVLDLSVNPTVPIPRGLWNGYYVHDCSVVNDTIWAANISDGKMSVINAQNKDNMTTITSWTNGPNPFPHNSALTSGRKFIFTTDETLTPPGRLKIWNIQDLTDIQLVNIWTPTEVFKNGVIHNVELYGNQLVAAYYSVGVKIWDVTTPGNPVEIGWYDTYPESNSNEYTGCWGVYKFPSGKIIASDRTRGLFVLRYFPPQNAAPKADCMTDKVKYFNGDSVQFVDASSNNPTSFQWTITGPQNFSSTLANPKQKFTALGNYTVKLRVSNAFGSDSITKVDYFRVNGSPLTAPSFPAPFVHTVITNRFDTSKVKFTWSNASRGGTNITYKFRIRKNGQAQDSYYIPSDNNGTDSAITFRKSRLDSIARELGFSGDSVITTCRLTAYNGLDSVVSGNNLLVTLKSTSVGIQNISSQIPDKYKLENNFPNPFNPSTNIKFQIPQKSFASIIIYDMLGREVITLLSEELNAGYYNYQFNAENLNSGIYFYTLVTDNFSETKKMVLVK